MASARATGAPRLLSPLRAGTLLFVALSVGALHAQTIPTTPAPTAARATSAVGTDNEAAEIQLLVGRSAVLNVGSAITRVSLTSPEVADALVTASQQILVHGKTPGTISMFVWDRSGAIKRFEVVVQRDLSRLNEQLQQLFPGEAITVASNGKDVVLSGTVKTKHVVEKAAAVAAGYVEKKDDVVNLLKLQEGVASNQVLLRVRFAEVSRTALTELGASFFTQSDGYKDWVFRTTTQQFSAPDFNTNQGGLVFSDFLNLFVFNTDKNIGTLIKALQNRGLFQSLAEPNLIAENGKEASFLAGGEYPYPVAQGSGANQSITIVFKEFGIRLRFTPTVLAGDLIHLKVAPEVSSLDFTNAIVASGFRVPALSTRRAETEVELRDGQTFAIAGLMNNTLTSQMQKIPGIGDIPILGLLFRSKATQKAQTELVVMITPQLMRRDSMGAAPTLPGLVDPYMRPPTKTIPPPPPGQVTQPARPPDGAASATPLINPASRAMPPTGAAAQTGPGAASSMPAGVPAGQAMPATPAQPAMPGMVDPATQMPAQTRPLTKEEKRVLEQARRELKKQQEEKARLMAEEEKLAAEQAAIEQREAGETRKQEEKLAREQAKRDAVAAKQAAEAAKKQAGAERKRGKALAEAEARLKAAQAAYQAEIDRTKKPQTPPQQQK